MTMQISDSEKNIFVWIFNGEGATFPSGVFENLDKAEEWIEKHSLSGVLTKYPVGSGAYDYAIKEGFFSPKKPAHSESLFVGRFSCAAFEHHHYEGGRRD